jgi:hypothetical protein
MENKIPTHLNMRIDPKLRYLTELASTISGLDLTKYVENALEESFKHITLREQPEPEYDSEGNVVPLDLEEERIQNEVKSIFNRKDDLWRERTFDRLEQRSILCRHLLSDEEKALINYVHTRKDLHISVEETHRLHKVKGYQFDRELIDSQWPSIIATFNKEWRGNK